MSGARALFYALAFLFVLLGILTTTLGIVTAQPESQTPPLFQGPAQGTSGPGIQVDTANFSSAGQAASPETTRGRVVPRGVLERVTFPGKAAPGSQGEPGSNEIDDVQAATVGIAQSDSPTLIADFQGMADSVDAFGFFHTPPDPIMAAGPGHVMGLVNSAFGIFGKTGGLQRRIDGTVWYQSALPGKIGHCVDTPLGCVFDPKVVYDQYAERWVMVWLATDKVSESWILVSASDDSDPNGRWCNWALAGDVNGATPAGNWSDYQGLGYDDQAVYVVPNQFSFAGPFDYTKIRILPKATLYNATCPAITWTDLWDLRYPKFRGVPEFLDFQVGTVRPAVTFDVPGLEHLMTNSGFQAPFNDFMVVYSLTDPLTSPTLTATSIDVAPSDPPPDANQRDGSTPDPTNDPNCSDPCLIDVGGDRIRNVVYRNGSLWTSHSVDDSDTGQFARARYVRIDVASETTLEDLSLGLPNCWYYYPAVAVDADSNLAMVFNRSCTGEYAGAHYFYKRADEPSQPTVELKAGEARYVKTFGGSRNRWGDYTGVAVDPVDDSIWMFAEYAASPEHTWGTWFGRLGFGSAVGPPSLVSPADQALLATARPLFDWEPSTGDVAGYRLVVSGDSPVLDIVVVDPTTSFQIADDLGDGMYSWRVTARDAASNQAHSQTRSFAVDTGAPTVALAYIPDRPVRDADTLVITATFDQAINGTPTISIDTTGTDLSATSMTDGGDQTTWTFSYDVPSGSDGTATVTIAGATDAAGNPNATATNNAFTIDNTAPGAPSLVAPANQAIVNDPRPLFDWDSSAGGVVDYRLAVSGDALVLDVGIQHPTTSFLPTVDLNDGAYTWRVTARDAASNRAHSGTRTFMIDTTAPTPPVLVIPAPDEVLGIGIVTLDRIVDFVWEPSTSGDINEYRLQVTTGGGAFNTIVDEILGSGATGSKHTMPFDGAFKWRVGAIDKLGNETASVDLDVRNFEIDTVRPADPVLLSPMGLINDATPLLDWDHPDTADVVEYVVFVRTADDRGPPPLIVAFITGDPPETQFQIPDQDALQDDRYVWEVWALDRADNVGFSETGDFTVDTQIAQPILKKPEQGDRVGNPTPTFEWTHSGDANPLNHYIRVSLGDISSPPAFEDEIQTEVLGLTLVGATPISVLPIGPGGTADYFWQVTVTDGVNTAESPVGRFILDLNVPVIRLDSPVAPDNILTSGDVVFRWSAVDIEPLFAGLGIGIQAIDPDFYDLRVAWATGDILSDFFHQEPDIEHTGDRGSRQVFPLLLSPPAPLGDGQYVWAVRGKKDELVGEFTEAPFIVDLVQPGTPVLQSPGSGDKISDNQPVFEWSSVSDTSGVTYIFELTSGDFAAPRFVAVVGSPSITPLDPLPDGDYMWRVYAVDGAGRTGNFSTVFNLTVDTAPPAPPVLVAPAQDAVVAAAKPTFQWQAATGDVADYRIQVTSGDIHTGPYDIDVVIAQPTSKRQMISSTGPTRGA